MNNRRVATLIILPLLSVSLTSCMASRRSETIFKPESYRSPQLDFTKVQAVAIMPVNAYTDERPELTSLINDGLPAELKGAQSAWRVLGYDDVLRKVNDKGLGRGYQNYIADLNVYAATVGMTPNFTAETKAFFNELAKEMKFQAILFTSYGFAEKQVAKSAFGLATYMSTESALRVNVVLYDMASQRAWWISTLTISGGSSMPDLASRTLKGIANDFGKGALRQL